MPLFYHYTDDKGAKSIIRSGRIMASLKCMASGDVAYGNGVYLTKLDPRTSTKAEIATNNWMNADAQSLKKTDNYFVVNIPESDVKDTKAKDRNIFLFGYNSDLLLHKYSWWLKNFDSGKILSSYKYQLASLGPAFSLHGDNMGDYIMKEDTVNGRPVYKRGEFYLFMTSCGRWAVSDVVGRNSGFLYQKSSKFTLGPDSNLPWLYVNEEDEWCEDDSTLKAYAWQR